MTLYEKAINKLLHEEDFSLITTEMLDERDVYGNSAWHYASKNKSLNTIPKRFFTKEALNQENLYGNTVWHYAAMNKMLKYIPTNLFTKDVLSLKNKFNTQFWEYVACYEQLDTVPIHLINKNLLDMKRFKDNQPVFNDTQINYIEDVLRLPGKLKDFFKAFPFLETDVTHRDSRLILEKVSSELVFRFVDIEDKVTLSGEGAFLNNENYKTLANVVSFIEQTYPGIEQSLILPKSQTLNLEPFVL